MIQGSKPFKVGHPEDVAPGMVMKYDAKQTYGLKFDQKDAKLVKAWDPLAQ